MTHRESIRHSFESQRAALADAIEKQRRSVSGAVASARQMAAQGAGTAPIPCSDDVWERLSAKCDAGNRLVISLVLMGSVPGMTGSAETQAQCAAASRRFLDALKAVIAEEVAKHAVVAGAAKPAGSADGQGIPEVQ